MTRVCVCVCCCWIASFQKQICEFWYDIYPGSTFNSHILCLSADLFDFASLKVNNKCGFFCQVSTYKSRHVDTYTNPLHIVNAALQSCNNNRAHIVWHFLACMSGEQPHIRRRRREKNVSYSNWHWWWNFLNWKKKKTIRSHWILSLLVLDRSHRNALNFKRIAMIDLYIHIMIYRCCWIQFSIDNSCLPQCL